MPCMYALYVCTPYASYLCLRACLVSRKSTSGRQPGYICDLYVYSMYLTCSILYGNSTRNPEPGFAEAR